MARSIKPLTIFRSRKHKKKGLAPLGQFMTRLNLGPEFQERMAEGVLFKKWEEIFGSFLAKKSRPRRIVKKRLEVAVDSSPLANQLHYMQTQMLQKLKEALPKLVITSFRFKVEPSLFHDEESLLGGEEEAPASSGVKTKRRIPARASLSRKLTESLNEIEDESLREIIRRVMIFNKTLQ